MWSQILALVLNTRTSIIAASCNILQIMHPESTETFDNPRLNSKNWPGSFSLTLMSDAVPCCVRVYSSQRDIEHEDMGKRSEGIKSESWNDVSEPNTTQNLGSLQSWVRIGQWFYLKFVSSSFESKTVKLPTFIVQTRFTCSRVNILNTLFSHSTEPGYVPALQWMSLWQSEGLCYSIAPLMNNTRYCLVFDWHCFVDWVILIDSVLGQGPLVLHCEGLLLTNKLVFSALAPACSGLIRVIWRLAANCVSLLSHISHHSLAAPLISRLY